MVNFANANNIRYSIRSKIDIRLNTGADRSRHGGHSQVSSRPCWATIPINVVCCLLLETGLSVSTASQTNELTDVNYSFQHCFILDTFCSMTTTRRSVSYAYLDIEAHLGHLFIAIVVCSSSNLEQTLRHSIHCKCTFYFNCATKRKFNQLRTMATF